MQALINKANGVKGICSRGVCGASWAVGGYVKHRDRGMTGREPYEGQDLNFLNPQCMFMATRRFPIVRNGEKRGNNVDSMPTVCPVRHGQETFPITVSILIKATHGIRGAGQFSDEEPRGEKTVWEPSSVQSQILQYSILSCLVQSTVEILPS